jgi:histidinol-phosphate aminotransferase
MPELGLADLLRPELAELAAYAPVSGDFEIRLDANEAPPLLSESARKRLGEVAAETAWERYPDPRANELRRAIARRFDVSPDQVLTGVGSDEVIALLLTALVRPRTKNAQPSVITTTPTFVMYRMGARARGFTVMEVPLDAGWDLSDDGVCRAIAIAPPNLVLLASPNNPTGTIPSADRLERVIEAARGALVVIDEAYAEYSSRDYLGLLKKHENVAILRTLSKVGFASLRVGWVLARPELIRELDKVRLPYNLPTVSQRLATLVLDELADDVAGALGIVKLERERVTAALREIAGVSPTESETNFVWLRTERPAGEVFEALAAKKILVRSFHGRGGRLAHQLRVTIGTRAENDAFLKALGEVV